jgi:hypothetical protein
MLLLHHLNILKENDMTTTELERIAEEQYNKAESRILLMGELAITILFFEFVETHPNFNKMARTVIGDAKRFHKDRKSFIKLKNPALLYYMRVTFEIRRRYEENQGFTIIKEGLDIDAETFINRGFELKKTLEFLYDTFVREHPNKKEIESNMSEIAKSHYDLVVEQYD